MSEPAVGGDLVVAARVATPEAFAPYGRLISAGERARLGGSGSVLVALDGREAGPRRVRHLQRYAGARRLLLSLGDAAMVLVVCGTGERPTGPATAFKVPGGTGVLLHEGIWHAGPLVLNDMTVLEMLETVGPADRLDRASVAEALQAEGLRVMLPEEFGAPGTGFDLGAEFAVTISDDLRGRLSLGCLAFDRLTVGESGEDLREEGERLAEDLKRQWGQDTSPGEIPALRPVRELYKSLGIDPTKTRPSSEALLRRVLQGKPLYRVNCLVDAINLCSMRMLVPFGVYDRARIEGPVVLRRGQPSEGYEGIARGRITVEGRPVLADREGAFGNPTADALRTSVVHGTARALTVLYLPPSMDEAGVVRFLDATSSAVIRHCGGTESGRRIVR